MDPNKKPSFDPKAPVTAILNQENAAPVPQQPAQKNDPVTLQQQINSELPNKGPKTGPHVIKTYESDIAEAVKRQHQSVAKIVIAEQKHKEANPVDIQPRRKFGLIVTSIILVLVGIAAIPAVNIFLNYQKQVVPVVFTKALITYDARSAIDVTGMTAEDFSAAILLKNQQPLTPSTIEYIEFTERITDDEGNTTVEAVGSEDVISLGVPTIAPPLGRSFDGDYMYGLYQGTQSTPAAFFIVKTSSYDQAFAGMLNFETKMQEAFASFIPSNLAAATFTDKIILNRDARVLAAEDGTVVFMYAFLDPGTLIITSSDEAFKEAYKRFIATQFVQ